MAKGLKRANVALDVIAGAYLGLQPGVAGLATMAKFDTHTVDLPQLLEVGRATFHWLQATEFAVIAVLAVLFAVTKPPKFDLALLVTVLLARLAQTLFVIPTLDSRVDAYLAGQTPGPSHSHNAFIALEAVKILALLALVLARRSRLSA